MPFGVTTLKIEESQLIQLIDNLAHNIDNRIQTDAILLDFQKAFDKVPHHRLLYKLKYYGISPQALNWVHSFLTNRTQQVLLEGNMSSSINVTSGVPQGSVLGPLLFLIYINDLPDYIQNNSTVKRFADDTIIYHPINNQQDSIALQEDLDSLQRWESDWLMHFHPQKCQTMHITNKRNIIHSTYTIHNHKLQTTNTAKYLGTVADQQWGHWGPRPPSSRGPPNSHQNFFYDMQTGCKLSPGLNKH